MNEQNMKPEQIRLMKLFQEREQTRTEAHSLNAYDTASAIKRQGSGDKPVKSRPTNSGPKQRPMKPIPKTSVKDVGKPAKTKRTTKAGYKPVVVIAEKNVPLPVIARKANQQIAMELFHKEIPENCPIQYR